MNNHLGKVHDWQDKRGRFKITETTKAKIQKAVESGTPYVPRGPGQKQYYNYLLAQQVQRQNYKAATNQKLSAADKKLIEEAIQQGAIFIPSSAAEKQHYNYYKQYYEKYVRPYQGDVSEHDIKERLIKFAAAKFGLERKAFIQATYNAPIDIDYTLKGDDQLIDFVKGVGGKADKAFLLIEKVKDKIRQANLHAGFKETRFHQIDYVIRATFSNGKIGHFRPVQIFPRFQKI